MNNNRECCTGLSKWLSPDLFKALSDPNRVAILARLAEGPAEQTVTEVAGCCPVNISVVSRHLRTLKDAGVLDADKRGKEVFYRVRIQSLVQLLRNLADALEACCPEGCCDPVGENK
ncbi:MAG: winged helix-turn-helix transcriptional regulator [Proteobacteria bacterium]|nr:winged helix-turn-helix transcriptional regulator [Pseudomonadota bacterium]